MIHPSDHSQRSIRLHLSDEQAMGRLAAALAGRIAPGMRVYLSGPLGSGKTTLVRALLRALGIREAVKSPSYTLVELYTISRLNLYHFDFFRFRDPTEWSDAGFREYFTGAAVCLVEWPEKAGGALPKPDLEILLGLAGTGREALLSAYTEAGEKCIEAASELKSRGS